MAYCFKCGNLLQEGSLFCPKCGVALTQSSTGNVDTSLSQENEKKQTREKTLFDLQALQLIFAQKIALYNEYDMLSSKIIQLRSYYPRTLRWVTGGIFLLIPGFTLVCIWLWSLPGLLMSDFAAVLASELQSVGLLTSPSGVGIVIFLIRAVVCLTALVPTGIIIFLGIFLITTPSRKRRRYAKEADKKEARKKQIVAELLKHYNSIKGNGSVPMGLEYTWPATIQIMINKVRQGSADTIKEAISSLTPEEYHGEIAHYL